jgi:glutamyl-tRNA synthetase
MIMASVITRMAPSPTGNLHIGTAYATMWPYVFARHKSGQFILRIEDTDRERSTKEFEENIIEGLEWLSFDWDGDIPHQMDRLDLYQASAQKLLNEGKAYYCFCTKEELDEVRKRQQEEQKPQVYSGKCRSLTQTEVENNLSSAKEYVIRYKLPEDRGVVTFTDLIHGSISTDSSLIGDIVIVRQTGIPLYNFAVVVDDFDMGITHVIRGEDHISNTPKQILLFEALGKNPPQYAHNPVILNQDRSGKLSKRTGSTSLDEFKTDGYLPEVMFNYIASICWTHPEGKEIFSKEELIKLFELKDMHHSPAAWNQEKLDWMNGEYIRQMSDESLSQRLIEFYSGVINDQEKIKKLSPLVKDRIKTLRDFELLTNFMFEQVDFDRDVFSRLKFGNSLRTEEVLGKILERLEKLPRPWRIEDFQKSVYDLATELELKPGDLFQSLRMAFSGKAVTPPLFECMVILGEEESLIRIKKAIEFLKNPEEV